MRYRLEGIASYLISDGRDRNCDKTLWPPLLFLSGCEVLKIMTALHRINFSYSPFVSMEVLHT